VERANAANMSVIAGVETRECAVPDLVLALRAGASGRPLPVLLTMTDHGPSAPASTGDVAFAPKGRPWQRELPASVRELTARAA